MTNLILPSVAGRIYSTESFELFSGQITNLIKVFRQNIEIRMGLISCFIFRLNNGFGMGPAVGTGIGDFITLIFIVTDIMFIANYAACPKFPL